jgi:hypothetical protein
VTTGTAHAIASAISPAMPIEQRVAALPPVERSLGNLSHLNLTLVSANGQSRSQVQTVSLGQKWVEGQLAHGEASSWTIDANSAGNERPTRIVREVWTSPELRVTLHSKQTDPRDGETSYRLTQINRSNPDADLFKPPAGYVERVIARR